MSSELFSIIAGEMSVLRKQVSATVKLLDD